MCIVRGGICQDESQVETAQFKGVALIYWLQQKIRKSKTLDPEDLFMPHLNSVFPSTRIFVGPETTKFSDDVNYIMRTQGNPLLGTVVVRMSLTLQTKVEYCWRVVRKDCE